MTINEFVTEGNFVNPEKIAAIDLYGFENAVKMWKNGEPEYEERMKLTDHSISCYLANKKALHPVNFIEKEIAQ